MKCKVNQIHKDEGDITAEYIKEVYNDSERVLFIKDERDTFDYNIKNQSMTSLKFNALLKHINEDKLVLNSSKFTLLAWQGFINVFNYDVIIIRLYELKPEFIHAFRTFYMGKHAMSLTKPVVLAFLKDIKEGSHVYLQSTMFQEDKDDDQHNDNLSCICLSTNPPQRLINYVKVKRILSETSTSSSSFLEKIDKLEKETLETTIDFINSKVDASKLDGIDTTIEVVEQARLLLHRLEQKRIIDRYANEGNVVVHSINFNLEQYTNVNILLATNKEKLKDLSTLSTLILFDEIKYMHGCEECEFNKAFENAIVEEDTNSLLDDSLEPLDSKLSDKLRIEEQNEVVEYKQCYIHQALAFKFRKVVYVKSDKNYPTDFIRNVVTNNKNGLGSLIKYCERKHEEYYTKNDIAVISLNFSIYLLNHVLYLINKCFARHFLFFNSPKSTQAYEATDSGRFVCVLELPRFALDDLFNMKIRSKGHVLKKDAYKEAAYLALVRLYESGFLDDHLCPVDQRFIEQNELYFNNISDAYGIQSRNLKEIYKEICNRVEEYEGDFSVALEKFRKDNCVDLQQHTNTIISIDDILRKQPECLKAFTNKFCIYQFNSSSVGLACSGGFEQSLHFKHVQIEYIGKKKFSDTEKILLIFYQIVFFSINFKRIIALESKAREYFYYVLPMKGKAIDFDYIQSLYTKLLINCVYDVKDEHVLYNNLLFNPITRAFLQYEGPADVKLTDKITKTLVSRIKHLRKKSSIEDLPHLSDVDVDLVKLKDQCSEKDDKSYDISYKQYFEIFYGCKLAKLFDDKNIVINASNYCSKNKTKTTELHSDEVIFVSNIKKTIRNDYNDFLLFFNAFEHCAIANEFICDKNLNVSLEAVASALSQRDIGLGSDIDLGYERLEFIGDSVLKYSVSKHLFTSKGYDLSKIVSTKDKLINNSYLYTVAQDLNLKKYISLIKFSENMFQPPAINKLSELTDTNNKLNDYIECLKGWGAFKNNNQEYFALKFSQKQAHESRNISNKKVYADIIEALIGVHYIEQGFDVAWEYIKSIGILDILENNKESSTTNTSRPKACKETEFKDEVKHLLNLLGLSNTPQPVCSSTSDSCKSYFDCVYENVLCRNKAKQIEKIIGYKFKNIGLLEKAVVHPSYNDNAFGSERFQKLELVGDCFLDLRVTDYIFKNYPEANPCELHTLRKGLVNNYTFATILFKSGLSDLIETGLGESHADFNRHKVSKVYSDIFESIAGAVVLDNDFCLEKTFGFFTKMLVLMKENARDC